MAIISSYPPESLHRAAETGAHMRACAQDATKDAGATAAATSDEHAPARAGAGASKGRDKDGAASLGINRNSDEPRAELPHISPVCAREIAAPGFAKIERKKDIREYSEEEKDRWKKERQRENAEKAAIARKWIAESAKSSRPPSICSCGRSIKGQSSNVYLTEDARVYHDRIACRSWACPVCAPKRAWSRALELQQALIAASAKGYKQLFITFTIPHTAKQKTATVIKHINAAYHTFRNYAGTRRALESFGFVGQIKSVDFTLGGNGTHAHFHTVYMFDSGEPVEKIARDITEEFTKQWDKAVYKETRKHISRKHGFDVEIIDIPAGDDKQAEAIALYTAKVISIYSTNPDKGKGSITPFDLLDLDREDEYKPLWVDFYKGTKGLQRVQFSPGLKKKLEVKETEPERPRQARIATIAPSHTDLLRNESTRQRFEYMITHRQARQAFHMLEELDPEPVLVSRDLVSWLDVDNLYIPPGEVIADLVNIEVERLATIAAAPV